MSKETEKDVEARSLQVGEDTVEIFGDSTNADVRKWLDSMEGEGQTADEILKKKK